MSAYSDYILLGCFLLFLAFPDLLGLVITVWLAWWFANLVMPFTLDIEWMLISMIIPKSDKINDLMNFWQPVAVAVFAGWEYIQNEWPERYQEVFGKSPKPLIKISLKKDTDDVE